MKEMNDSDWKILGSYEIGPHPLWMPITRYDMLLPDGKRVPDIYIHHLAHGAMIFPLLFDGTVLLIKEYSYGLQKLHVNFPKGRIEPNDSPEATAHKELKEETGAIAKHMHFLGSCDVMPDKASTKVYFFLAEIDHTGQQKLETTEFIDVIPVSMGRLGEMVARGELTDARANVLYYRVKEFLSKK